MLHIFPLQIRNVARMNSLKSAWRDQAENPESYGGSLLFRGAQESMFAAPDCKDASVPKKSGTWLCSRQFARHPPGYNRKNWHDARSCVRCKCWRHEWARVRISSVDILPPGFGDANVATEHNQSNRRNRCRQGKDKPHRPGMPRTVCGTKRR